MEEVVDAVNRLQVKLNQLAERIRGIVDFGITLSNIKPVSAYECRHILTESVQIIQKPTKTLYMGAPVCFPLVLSM